MLAVDGREAIGVKAPPQLIVRALQPLLGCVEASDKHGVLGEQGVELCRELACEIGSGAAHDARAFDRVGGSGARREPAVTAFGALVCVPGSEPWTGHGWSYGHRTRSPSGRASTTSCPRRPHVQLSRSMTGRPASRQAWIARLTRSWCSFLM